MAGNNKLQVFLDSCSVAPDVFKLRPDYRALLIAVDNLNPGGPSDEFSENLLSEAESSAKSELAKYPVTDIPHVAAWQEAYKAFGSKPKKFRNSVDALTRRVEAGLPRVNYLTDTYNAVSVKYQIPLGGEDLAKYSGPARLIRAEGTEKFETKASGETVVEHPDKGEVVWCDDAGVTCRRWNWRQGPRTALTEKTTSVLFILDVLGPITNEVLQAAEKELVNALKQTSPNLCIARRLLEA